MSLWSSLKKRGFVITKTFHLDKPPETIEVSVKKALDREKVRATLLVVSYFLKGLLSYKTIPDPIEIRDVLYRVESCLSDLSEIE
jgi:hypothetical protein